MKKSMVYFIICVGLILFFFNTPAQSNQVDQPRPGLDTIIDRLTLKGGPVALISLTTDNQWLKSNKGLLQAKGIQTRQVNPDQYRSMLKGLKEFYHKSPRDRRSMDKHRLYVYPVSFQRFADKDFLELMAYHNDVFYLDGTHQFYTGDMARNQLLMHIAKKITAPEFEKGILNFINWFDYLYKTYEGVIPTSFTLFVPSKRQNGSDISKDEINQVLKDFYNKIVKRFAVGFSIFKAKGSWMLSTEQLQKENVKLATVDGVLDKTQIFATTLLLIVQAMEVQIQLDQDSVLIKVFNFPFFIGN